MNLPLPAHRLTLDELMRYAADTPVCAALIRRIEELELELEEEKEARDADDDKHSLALGDMKEKLEACEYELARVKESASE